MRALKIASIVVGALLILIGLGLFLPGGLLLWLDQTQRDESGFLETAGKSVGTDSYALTTPDITLHVGSEWADWVPKTMAGTVRLRVEPEAVEAEGGSKELFVGIGPASRVDEYLSGVAHDQMVDFGVTNSTIRYRHSEGGPPPTPPGEQDFWVASLTGADMEFLDWNITDGDWTAVIMNADGSAGVEAQASIGAKLNILFPIAIGIIVAGVIALAVGILLVVLGARRLRPEPVQQPGFPGPYPPQYPPQQPSQYQSQRPHYPPQPSGPVHQPPGHNPPVGQTPAPPFEPGRQQGSDEQPPAGPGPVPPPS